MALASLLKLPYQWWKVAKTETRTSSVTLVRALVRKRVPYLPLHVISYYSSHSTSRPSNKINRVLEGRSHSQQ